MIEPWLDALRARGAHIDAGVVTHFESLSTATAADPCLADLSHRGLIGVVGEDSESFLQGQLSNDVRALTGHAKYAAYCTPKGRMLAFMLMWRDESGYFLELPAAIAEATRKRLSMYVLRAKAKLRDATGERVRIGLAGNGSAALLERALVPGGVPPAPLATAAHEGVFVIALGAERYELVVDPTAAGALWDRLAQGARPIGVASWENFEIRAGIPDVVPETLESFVPQMANLDAIGAISFTKGCYPGQEIVARTRYLGQIKRRMLRAHSDGATPPRAGQEVYSPTLPGQSVGTVVRSAPAPEGGYELLAVVQVEAANHAALSLGTPDGTPLRIESLPYSV